ncbi:MAG TPA: DUF6531 domain-containing protein [Thermoanaerobaculia bacterium]|nr:DUF6531 domain-containing protein [Thermoanaerobaculia bacterium]
MKLLQLAFLIGLALCGRDDALAVVNAKNANYAAAWLDLNTPKGLRIVERAYNSRTLFNGIFGFGWSSDLEDTLTSPSANEVLFTMAGNGSELSFARAGVDLFVSPKYGSVRLVGGRLVLSLTPQAALDIVGAGCDECRQYQFEKQTMIFDSRGRVLEKLYPGGGRLTFEYGADLLRSISDGDGHRFTLEYYSNGHVKKVFSSDGLEARYSYDPEGNLISALNVLHNKYSYSYDALHNLVREDFPDQTANVLTYDLDSDFVTSFRGRDSTLVNYSYFLHSRDHYWSDVVRTRGSRVERERSEFLYRDHRLRRSVEIYGENLSDIVWNGNGYPESVTLNGIKRSYKFDVRGQVIEKATRLENLQIPGLRVQEAKPSAQ